MLCAVDRSRLLDDRGLKIRKVKPGDEGTYVCRVQNRFGWQEAEATLTVHGQHFITTLSYFIVSFMELFYSTKWTSASLLLSPLFLFYSGLSLSQGIGLYFASMAACERQHTRHTINQAKYGHFTLWTNV